MSIRRTVAAGPLMGMVFFFASACGNDENDSVEADAGAAVDANAGPVVDASAPDAARTLPRELPNGCLPDDFRFVPSADSDFVPPLRNETACSAAQVTEFVDACVGGNAASCRAYRSDPEASACASCIFTEFAAPAWGPFVTRGDEVLFTNIHGCSALVTGDVSGAPGTCGRKTLDRQDCFNSACGACTTQTTVNACLAEIEPSDAYCRPYLLDGSCLDALFTCGGANSPDQNTYARELVGRFCGGL